MQATFMIHFFDESRPDANVAFLKTDLQFTPTLEMEFEHPAWHDAKKAVWITANLESGGLTIYLGGVSEVDVPDYEAAGWKIGCSELT